MLVCKPVEITKTSLLYGCKLCEELICVPQQQCARAMADSWQNFLYEEHSAVTLSLLRSRNSVKLLDVFIKKGRKGSKPVIQNVGSMVTLGSSESEETVNRLREGLASFESSGSKNLCDRSWFLDITQIFACFLQSRHHGKSLVLPKKPNFYNLAILFSGLNEN
jgi:hypothetical protein